MITVRDVIRALRTFPPEAEAFLDFNPRTGEQAVHVHVQGGTKHVYECFPMWDGENEPEIYHPIVTVHEGGR